MPDTPKPNLIDKPEDKFNYFFSIAVANVSVVDNKGITGTPTIFTFTFDKELFSGITTVPILCIIEEPKFNLRRQIRKNLTLTSRTEGTLEMTFPESLAGATLKLLFSVINIHIKPSLSTVNLKIERPDGLEEIEKVYWAEQEHAMWGSKLTQRKELCKNEVGFLHIYTKGLFGQEVHTLYLGKANGKDHHWGQSKAVMRDNVISIPYSMSAALSGYKSKEDTFDGDSLELYGFASTTASFTVPKNTDKLTLLCKKDEANPSKSTTVPPVKVIISSDEEEKAEGTRAKCSIEFRPDGSYKGDYGFDWMRKGDTGATKTYHNDYDFEDTMGKHYYGATNKVENDGNKHGDAFKKDKDSNTNVLNYDTGALDTSFGDGKMHKKLKLRYRRLIFSWKDTNGAPFETCTPIMTLMKGKTAQLDMHLDIKEIPEKIVFEFNNDTGKNFLKLTPDEINSELAVGMDKTSHKLQIECTGEFDYEYTLFARAFGKNDPKGQICGMIRILPNGEMYQHKVKIVFVSVKTKLNSNEQKGSCQPDAEQKLKDILGQAFLFPEIITTKKDGSELEIDTTKSTSDFIKNFCTKDSKGKVFIDDADTDKSRKMKEYLLKELSAIDNNKYEHYLKVFFIKEDVNTLTVGYSWGEKYVVCFNSTKKFNTVVTHEILHALELAHPFDAYSRNTKFTYEFLCTDNVMDYVQVHRVMPDARTLYHWQWQIINVKIK